jgi:hypothetical protein
LIDGNVDYIVSEGYKKMNDDLNLDKIKSIFLDEESIRGLILALSIYFHVSRNLDGIIKNDAIILDDEDVRKSIELLEKVIV